MNYSHADYLQESGFEDLARSAARRDLERAEPELRVLDPSTWEGTPVPERQWIVSDLIPARTVTLLTGEGAAGKSTLALQLATARALRGPWLSTIPKPGRTLVLSAEDEEDELHRRLDAVRTHYGARFSDLGDMRLVDLVGEDAVLGTLSKGGTISSTALFRVVCSEIEKFSADLVIVDALADVFAGDENNRSQARQFVGLLKRPARQLGCAFLCLAHPSLTGINSGTGSSGSTGWGNSVRSRLVFAVAKAKDGTVIDADLRTLTVNKSNYGPAGAMLTLKWQEGVYVAQAGANSLDKMARQNQADAVFVELLDLCNAQGQEISPKPSATFAPTFFAEHPSNAHGIGKDLFKAAMQRLLVANRISIQEYGPSSRRRTRLILTQEETGA